MEKQEDPIDNVKGECNFKYARYLSLLHEMIREVAELNIFNMNFLADFSCRYSGNYAFINTLPKEKIDSEIKDIIRTKLWWHVRQCIDEKKTFKP